MTLEEMIFNGLEAKSLSDVAYKDAYKQGYILGLIEGIVRFAWWKDGTQYVGTCGTTLKEAIAKIKTETDPL